jgi:Zn-dependent metalloprotease
VAAAYVVKEYRTARNGVTHLLFKQRVQGADVFNAEWVVNIDRDGRVLNAGGDLHAAPAYIELPAPASSREAVRAALKAVNPKLAQGFLAPESRRYPRKSNGVRYDGGALAENVERGVGLARRSGSPSISIRRVYRTARIFSACYCGIW